MKIVLPITNISAVERCADEEALACLWLCKNVTVMKQSDGFILLIHCFVLHDAGLSFLFSFSLSLACPGGEEGHIVNAVCTNNNWQIVYISYLLICKTLQMYISVYN